MEQRYLMVEFEQYCKTCQHEEKAGVDDPCNECLDRPINLHSHKPVNWKPKED